MLLLSIRFLNVLSLKNQHVFFQSAMVPRYYGMPEDTQQRDPE